MFSESWPFLITFFIFFLLLLLCIFSLVVSGNYNTPFQFLIFRNALPVFTSVSVSCNTVVTPCWSGKTTPVEIFDIDIWLYAFENLLLIRSFSRIWYFFFATVSQLSIEERKYTGEKTSRGREPTNSRHIWCRGQNRLQSTFVIGECSH